MTYFKHVKDLQDLRKQYRDLLKKFHPDNGGNEEDAKKINVEYSELFDGLKKNAKFESREANGGEKESSFNPFDEKMDAAIREAIQKVIHLSGIQIEICGCWVWISGNTFPVKDILKEAGYFWSKSKKKWYFRTGDYSGSRKRGHNMDYIYKKYGREAVESKPLATIC